LKRLVIALFLLSAAVFIAVWSGIVFRSELNSLNDSIEHLIDVSQSSSDEILKEETSKVLSEWEKASSFLHSFVLHEGMDILEQNITSLPLLIEHSDRLTFRNKYIEAMTQIENLLNSEKISLENIF
jgi:hypothetical protein